MTVPCKVHRTRVAQREASTSCLRARLVRHQHQVRVREVHQSAREIDGQAVGSLPATAHRAERRPDARQTGPSLALVGVGERQRDLRRRRRRLAREHHLVADGLDDAAQPAAIGARRVGRRSPRSVVHRDRPNSMQLRAPGSDADGRSSKIYRPARRCGSPSDPAAAERKLRSDASRWRHRHRDEANCAREAPAQSCGRRSAIAFVVELPAPLASRSSARARGARGDLLRSARRAPAIRRRASAARRRRGSRRLTRAGRASRRIATSERVNSAVVVRHRREAERLPEPARVVRIHAGLLRHLGQRSTDGAEQSIGDGAPEGSMRTPSVCSGVGWLEGCDLRIRVARVVEPIRPQAGSVDPRWRGPTTSCARSRSATRTARRPSPLVRVRPSVARALRARGRGASARLARHALRVEHRGSSLYPELAAKPSSTSCSECASSTRRAGVAAVARAAGCDAADPASPTGSAPPAERTDTDVNLHVFPAKAAGKFARMLFRDWLRI